MCPRSFSHLSSAFEPCDAVFGSQPIWRFAPRSDRATKMNTMLPMRPGFGIGIEPSYPIAVYVWGRVGATQSDHLTAVSAGRRVRFGGRTQEKRKAWSMGYTRFGSTTRIERNAFCERRLSGRGPRWIGNGFRSVACMVLLLIGSSRGRPPFPRPRPRRSVFGTPPVSPQVASTRVC